MQIGGVIDPSQVSAVSFAPSALERTSRPLHIAIAAIGLLICTNGPSTFSALHWFRGGISWQFWTFAYPFGAVAVAGAVLLVAFAHRRGTRVLPWPFVPLAAYVAWTLASATWSVSPYSTPSLALTGIGIACFGIWFGWTLSVDEHAWSVAVMATVAVVLSLVPIVWWPAYGRMPIPYDGYGGEWRGIFGNRNSLAPVCMLGLVGVVGLIALRPSGRRIVIGIPIIGLHLLVLRGAESDTSFIALALCVMFGAAVPILWAARRRGAPGWAAGLVGGAAVVIGGLLLASNLSTLATRLGRDPTLSSRRLIWSDVRGLISVHPVRGYGYWAFWDRPDLTADTYANIGVAYGSAHNSVLEVLLGLGVVGLAFYAAIAVASIGGVFAWTWRQPSAASWWWVLVVVYLVAENMMESFVLWHSYNWVLFIAAAFVPFGPSAQRSNDAAEDA